MTPRNLSACALLLLAASCHGGVERHVALAPEDGWPRAQTTVVGDALRVEVTKMERFRGGIELTAWARGHHGPAVRLGVVVPGTPATFTAQTAGVVWSEVHAVLLTEERATPIATEPSATAQFQGVPGGPLAFAGAGSMAGATVVAHIADGALAFDAANVPPLGARTHYGVWLVGPGAADATRLGQLVTSGRLAVAGLADPALRREVLVTIEFDSGPPEPALESVVLRGAIPVTAEAPGAAGPAAAPPAGGDHGGHVH